VPVGKFKQGDYWAICDRCGFKHYASNLRDEWTGLKVCGECFETRHPRDFERIPRTESPPPWTRPEPTDIEIDVPYVDDTVGVQS
jgi:hypothetical protein